MSEKPAIKPKSGVARKGVSLVEVLIAAVVMATVLMGMGLYQSATVRANQQERWRTFALQKSVQMMQEVMAFQATTHASRQNGLDSLDDNGNYSYLLTIDPMVTVPSQALSDNMPYKAGYRYVRQINVNAVPNDPNARLVTVSLYLSDGGAQASTTASTPLATVTNLISSTAANSQPTQVYDMYFIDIENAGWKWQDPVTLERYVRSAVDTLQANNVGLEIRTHMIRRSTYGRDSYYQPYVNRNLPLSPAGSGDKLPWVYFYPGNADNTVYTYNPSVMSGQISVDGSPDNGWVKTASTSSYYENAQAYSFADQYNHAVRYPDELMKFRNNGSRGEPSLRMLMDQLAAGNLNNAIIVNLHGEVLPMPPGRNYADAAKVPQDTASSATAFQTQWGVSGISSAADVVDGSRARLVTHPRLLSVSLAPSPAPNIHQDYPNSFPLAGSPSDNPNNTVELRVYPYLTSGLTTEPVAAFRNGQIVVRGLKNSALVWDTTAAATPTPAPTATPTPANCGQWWRRNPPSGDDDKFFYGPSVSNPGGSWASKPAGQDGVGAAGYYYYYDSNRGNPAGNAPWMPTFTPPGAPSCGGTPPPPPCPSWHHATGHDYYWGPYTWNPGAGYSQYSAATFSGCIATDFYFYKNNSSTPGSPPNPAPACGASPPPSSPTPVPSITPPPISASDTVEVDVLDNGGAGAYTWKRIWPKTVGSTSLTNIAVDTTANALYMPVDPGYVPSDDPTKDLHAGDLVINLAHIPFTNPVSTGAGVKLHGLNYFPDPQLPSFDHMPGGATNGNPYNTARFRVLFKVKSLPADPISGDTGYLRVLSTLGDDPVLFHHQAPNRSETMVWAGQQPPYEELYQLQGDPRHYPYEDPNHRDMRSPTFNPYFVDLTSDNAYIAGSGGQAWNTFAGTSNGWGNLANGKLNFDVPRYTERWRQGLIASNALFVNASGGLANAVALGGEKIVRDANQNTLTISGVPFYGSGTAKPDDLAGNGTSPNPAACQVAKLDASNNVTWYAKPWIGELYPDDEWASWSANGNLKASPYALVDYTKLPAEAGNYVHLMSAGAYGEVAFFNGGNSGASRSDWTVQDKSVGGSGPVSSTGTAMLASLNFFAPGTFLSERPVNITSTDSTVKPPQWTSAEWQGWGTKVSWLLPSGPSAYYTQVSPASDNAVAPLVMTRSGKNGYVLIDDADGTDRQMLPKLALASTLEAFFDTGNTAYGGEAANLLPRIHIDSPQGGSQLSGSKNVAFGLDWDRWNTTAYSNLVTNYATSGNKPSLKFNLKYSPDSGGSWFFVQDGAGASTGVLDVSGSHGLNASDTPYQWDTTSVPNGNYLLRLECFRNDPGSQTLHYSYHQLPYQVKN